MKKPKKCPVCGWLPPSGRGNVLNHIKSKARAELFNNLLFGEDQTHAHFIRANVVVINREHRIAHLKGYGPIKTVPTRCLLCLRKH